MNHVNQKILDAVIEKAEKVCPDSLALIGIYGSVATGETHQRSDLDLLILIRDDAGGQLGTAFLLDDKKIGYDIYCTNWEGLRFDAECHHAQLSKLLDSKIVYVKDPEAYEQLCQLREQAKRFLSGEDRFQRVDALVEKAKVSYANACLHDTLGQVRLDVFGVMYYLMDAVMLFHGQYFKRGTKKMLEELSAVSVDATFLQHIEQITKSKDISQMRSLAKDLLRYAASHLKQEEKKAKPSEQLKGTYEEIYSNWRNKVEEATKQKHCFASFVNMCNLQYMLDEIASENDIGVYHIMEAYDPDHLDDNVQLFDAFLEKYEEVYKAAGMSVRRYPDVEAFVSAYLGKNG